MRSNNRLFRLTATVALGALLWDSALPLTAVAQPAPPPLPPSASGQPDLNQGDPPSRVGRIARITGAVSFHNQGDTQWSTASVNYPVTAGNAFWTEPGAEAQLEISDSRIALAGGSEFDVATLDAGGLQGVAALGETLIHARGLGSDEAWSVQTPRGLVRLGGEGRYDVVVGTTDQPTLVTVVDGSAQIEGPNLSLQVAAGQTATLTGSDNFEGSVGPAQRSAFLTAQLDAERPRPAPSVAVPVQVAAMPGGGELYREGSWGEAPEYGHVWYPPVASDWVPYRHGHWAYVAPWGWTWIDDASWGFAPFHYGRWLQIGGRWAWTPGAVVVRESPVYAPALVTFIGIGAGVAIGAALASGSIGWVPLGPREPFRPWYHTSDRYVRQVNINHVTNVTNITNNNVTVNNFVNRGAATSIPAAAMTGSRPVQGVARPVTAQEFAAARPIVGQQQPLRPAATTAGVTPVVARQLNLAPAPAVRPAPGPAVATRGPGLGGPGFARPALAPGGAPGATRAGLGAPGVGAAPSAVPGAAPLATQPNRPGVAPVAPGGTPPLAGQPNRSLGAAPAGVPAGRPGTGVPAVPGQPNRGLGTAPGAPAVQPGPGAPAIAGLPNRSGAVPAQPPLSRPGAGPAPGIAQPNRPIPGPQTAPRPGGAEFARPTPGGVPQPQAAPRPVPQVAPQAAPAARNVAPPAAPPRPAPQVFAPAPRPAAPPAPIARPAPPPVQIARPAPPPAAIARPAPQPAPHPAPAPAPARQKRPGEP
jgi:hypothetical protein